MKSSVCNAVDGNAVEALLFALRRRGEMRGVFVTSHTYKLSQRKRIAHSIECKMQVTLFSKEKEEKSRHSFGY